jgi:hypothetical protein
MAKKSSFFLNGPAFTLPPPPLLMARPLEEDFFFAASLTYQPFNRNVFFGAGLAALNDLFQI